MVSHTTGHQTPETRRYRTRWASPGSHGGGYRRPERPQSQGHAKDQEAGGGVTRMSSTSPGTLPAPPLAPDWLAATRSKTEDDPAALRPIFHDGCREGGLGSDTRATEGATWEPAGIVEVPPCP
jgi:hypothetical protein